MKMIHISDLHFGKVIHGTSMLENGDQPYWTDRFLEKAEEIKPDAVLIAGDLYDRGSPSGEAMKLAGLLIEGLASMGICVMITAGNHDSGTRMEYMRDTLARQNIHIAGTVRRDMIHVTLRDGYGPVTFWLMPYVFPAAVAQALGDESIRDYEPAVRRLLGEQPIDVSQRNVIIAHQNVTANGTEMPRGGSESTVGGVGKVDFTAFDAFDYAALGHIHAAYHVGRREVRYSGSPMCYHFNETRQQLKGPLLVELPEKGTPPKIETLYIPPLHPMREMRGKFEELRETELARQTRGEYLKLIITDRPMTPEISDFFDDLAQKRGSVLMDRVSEYRRFGDDTAVPGTDAVREKTVEELFADFYAERRGGEQPDEKDFELLRQAGEILRTSHADPSQPNIIDAKLTDALLGFLMKQEGND